MRSDDVTVHTARWFDNVRLALVPAGYLCWAFGTEYMSVNSVFRVSEQ
jgi:hypothetical protein